MGDKSGPRFVQYFDEVLTALRELGGSGRPSEIVEFILASNELDDSEMETLNDGTPRYSKNINWARFYLAKAGYIDGSRRGVWALTEKGMKASLNHREALTIFTQVQEQVKQASEPPSAADEDDTPDNAAHAEIGDHRMALRQTLLRIPANGFERLCQRILREAGFEKVIVTGQVGDGGIDGKGILRINPFVSFQVCFQCKRYSGSVGAAAIRDFRGSIDGKADKGILMTTGNFTQDARKEAQRDGAKPIELVDGEQLIDMLEELELGLIKKRTVTVYSLDHEFFDEFD